MTRGGLVLLLTVLVLPLGGCMYHVEHRIPMDATFGEIREPDADRTPFRNKRVKRYILGGVFPWALTYNSSRHLVDPEPGRRIEALEIHTRFSWFDALIRFVPYLPYVLAQRTVEVRGVYVDPASRLGAVAFEERLAPRDPDADAAPVLPAAPDPAP